MTPSCNVMARNHPPMFPICGMHVGCRYIITIDHEPDCLPESVSVAYWARFNKLHKKGYPFDRSKSDGVPIWNGWKRCI